MSINIHKNDLKNQLCSRTGKRIGESITKDWLDVPEYLIIEETGNISDGYHTFDELYEFRKLYNACLFNEWADRGVFGVHKSLKHHDGELCFGGGWFIVVATLPDGQISNHYEIKDWDLFRCRETDVGEKWDGHTSSDVVERLKKVCRGWIR